MTAVDRVLAHQGYLTHIFCHLGVDAMESAHLVCKRWRELAIATHFARLKPTFDHFGIERREELVKFAIGAYSVYSTWKRPTELKPLEGTLVWDPERRKTYFAWDLGAPLKNGRGRELSGNTKSLFGAVELETGMAVACLKPRYDTSKNLRWVKDEYEIVRQVKGIDGVIQTYYGISDDRRRSFLIFQRYYDRGDLSTRLIQADKNNDFPTEKRAKMVNMLARAMRSLHQRGIGHLDLTCGNVLIKDDETPVITDFGLGDKLTYSAQIEKDIRLLGDLCFELLCPKAPKATDITSPDYTKIPLPYQKVIRDMSSIDCSNANMSKPEESMDKIIPELEAAARKV